MSCPFNAAASGAAGMLENAIPAHLQVTRSRPLRCPAGFVPKTVSLSARFGVDVKEIVMVVFGVQSKNSSPSANTLLGDIKQELGGVNGAGHFDTSTYTDKQGYHTDLIMAYWKSKPVYTEWQSRLAPGWWFTEAVGHEDKDGDVAPGVFMEEFVIDVHKTETTFSHPSPEGYAHLADSWSGATDSHEYYGGARDRIAASQTDALEPSGKCAIDIGQTYGNLVVISGHDNLCLLRSGQDWQKARVDEVASYKVKLQPALNTAMDDLMVNGIARGCYFNRFVEKCDEAGGVLDSTFSFSAWRSLAELEKWTQKSREHVKIFTLGIQHYENYGDDAALELYHELYVLPEGAQKYSYYNCHPKTGMMNGCHDGPVSRPV